MGKFSASSNRNYKDIFKAVLSLLFILTQQDCSTNRLSIWLNIQVLTKSSVNAHYNI